MMAVVATATKKLLREVRHLPGMSNPFIVTVSPDKSNGMFPFIGTFKPLIEEVQGKEEICTRDMYMYQIVQVHVPSILPSLWVCRTY